MRKNGVVLWMAAFAALASVAAKCSNDDEEGKKVSIKPSETNLCRQFAEVVCYNAFACCSGKTLENQLGVTLTTTEQECRDDMELYCESAFAEYLYALDQQTVSVDLDKVEACLEETLVPGDQCFPIVSVGTTEESCSFSTMFTGLQAEGEPCVFDFECALGTRCGPDRVCHAQPDVGEPCDNGVCAPGAFCGMNADGDYECMAEKAVGEECNAMMRCETGAFCKPFPAGQEPEVDTDVPYAMIPTGTCVALGAIGDPCEGNAQCASGTCLPGRCDNGNSCYTDDDCAVWGSCSTGGGSCATDADCNSYCQGGTWPGNPCTADADCPGQCTDAVYYCGDGQGNFDFAASCTGPGDTVSCANNATGYTTCAEYSPASCTVEPGTCVQDTCVGAQTGTCSGTPVCAETYLQRDYCQEGIDLLQHADSTYPVAGGDVVQYDTAYPTTI